MLTGILREALQTILVVFLSGLATAACLCIFQLTDFLAEYVTVFGKLFKINIKFNDREEFLEWLAKCAVEKESTVADFFYRLLWCPYCLGTWFSFFFCAISGLSFGWFLMAWFASMWLGVLLRLFIAKIDTEKRDA